MGALVGDKAPELDWLIQPGRGIIGEFYAFISDEPYDYPAETVGWLVVVDKCGKETRYEFEVSGNRLYVHIPLKQAALIEDRAKFRAYLWYPGEVEPILWGEGKGVRQGW
jgi:hypothetical protein